MEALEISQTIYAFIKQSNVITMSRVSLKRIALRLLIASILCMSLTPSLRAHQISETSIPDNIRQTLLTSAQTSDPDFPSESREPILTHFSHVCELSTEYGQILYVADRRAVIAGMLAPRGLNYITFFSEDFMYLGKFRYSNSRPLWCDGGKLYLLGDLDADNIPSVGNVIDVSRGFQNIQFYREKAYGSSG